MSLGIHRAADGSERFLVMQLYRLASRLVEFNGISLGVPRHSPIYQ